MTEMFRYLTGILEKDEQRIWKILTVVCFFNSLENIFNICYGINLFQGAFGKSQIWTALTGPMVFMGVLLLAERFVSLYKAKILNRFEFQGAQKLSVKIYKLLLKEDLQYHNQKSTVQALTIVRSDTMSCMKIITACIEIWSYVFTMVVYSAVLLCVSGWIGMVSCLLLFLAMTGMFFFHKTQMATYGKESRMYMIKANAQVTIAYGLFKEMKLHGCLDPVLQKYDSASMGYAQVESKYKYRNSLIKAMMQTSITFFRYGVLAVLLIVGINTPSVLVPMAAYLVILNGMITMGNNILERMNDLEFSRKAYEALRECFVRYTEIQKMEKERESVRKKELTFSRGLFVRNLSFAYNERTEIFKDAAIDIPAGYSVAVIGTSGAGKTTLLDLLLGLLKAQEGSIRYDDYDVVSQTDGEGSCWAQIGDIISYIPQTVYLNGETVENNVVLFEEENKIDEERVIDCLKCAQVWNDIEQMPNGIHTLIGENGIKISGGQRQRIALARALYKDFELLIMDEATAALDMETEKAVIDSIRQLRGNKTMLMVTHHASLANECDIVYKIENKKMVRVR